MKFALIAAGALLVLPLSPAAAGPADGVADACVKAFEARAKATGRPNRFAELRHKLCGCLEKKLNADSTVTPDQGGKVKQIFIYLGTDRKKAREMQRTLGSDFNKKMRSHTQTCTREVVEASKKKGGAKPNPAPKSGEDKGDKKEN